MHLETERLYLLPLSAKQISLWITNLPALEEKLNCTYSAEPMEGIFLDIVKEQADKTAKEEENYLYHTFWFLIEKNSRTVVGSADFKNMPDENGRVEIGYGLGKAFEGNGYMTEAVKAMCNWALVQKGIFRVVAETEPDNIASQKVLERCGFTLFEKGETCWWEL